MSLETQKNSCLPSIEILIELNIEDNWHDLRGMARLELELYLDAIKDFDESIKREPVDSATLTNRGLAKYYLGKNEDAIKDFDKSIKINPKNPPAFNNRGQLNMN